MTHSADSSRTQTPEPTQQDYSSAEQVLGRLTKPPELGTRQYQANRQSLAQYRADIGADAFDLRYGLRLPRNAVEQAEADFFQGRITKEEFREKLKADAERPVDVDMLSRFCEAYEQQLHTYSKTLQTIISIATDQHDPNSWRTREPEVDCFVESLSAKLPLWKEHLSTVFNFLAELRAEHSSEPVRSGEYTAESAHMLATRIIRQVVESWRQCKEIAERSQTDPSYLYSASASALFYETCLPGLPKPNDLMSLMALERARALKALKKEEASQTQGPPSVTIHTDTVHVASQLTRFSGEGLNEGDAPPRKPRLKREQAEPLIRQQLHRRPHDTAKEVAEAVGCSVGVVAESPAWKANRTRLSIAEREGRDPRAVNLDVKFLGEHGIRTGGLLHGFREDQEVIDEALDQEEKELLSRLIKYKSDHPRATTHEIARASGCTAGDVERRQAILERLVQAQRESAAEEGVDLKEDGTSGGQKQQKWVRKKP